MLRVTFKLVTGLDSVIRYMGCLRRYYRGEKAMALIRKTAAAGMYRLYHASLVESGLMKELSGIIISFSTFPHPIL